MDDERRHTAGHEAGAKPIRGPLRVDVSTSSDVTSAGQTFSLFVHVQNPFEVPITLMSVSTYLPYELEDIAKADQEVRIRRLQERQAELEETAGDNGRAAQG